MYMKMSTGLSTLERVWEISAKTEVLCMYSVHVPERHSEYDTCT